MSPLKSEPDEALWDFSLRTYAQPGVEQACLSLQNDHHLDVNIVLYCFWLGLSCGAVRPVSLNRPVALADSWSSAVVWPLRHARLELKRKSEEMQQPLRVVQQRLMRQVKALELQAEKCLQVQLARTPVEYCGQPGLPACAVTLQAYLASCNTTAGGGVVDLLVRIAAAARPESLPSELDAFRSSLLKD